MLIKGKYTMLADVYEQTTTQSPSGQIKRGWDYDNPTSIECLVRMVQTVGASRAGSGETWGPEYENIGRARMWTVMPVTRRHRIGNVRHVNVYGEAQEWDIEFDVVGVIPIHDAFGNLLEYEVLLDQADG